MTGDAVKAAQDSAKALPAIERTYVFVRIYHTDVKLSDDGPFSPVQPFLVAYDVVNLGKTPAVLQEVRVGVRRSDAELPADAWADEPSINLRLNALASGDGLASNSPLTSKDQEPMSASDADQIKGGACASISLAMFSTKTYSGKTGKRSFAIDGIETAESLRNGAVENTTIIPERISRRQRMRPNRLASNIARKMNTS